MEKEVVEVTEVDVDSWDNLAQNILESEITNLEDLCFFGKALITSTRLYIARVRAAFL